MQTPNFQTNSPLEQRVFESLVHCCREIERLQKERDQIRSTMTPGCRVFSGDELEKVRKARSLGIQITAHAATGHTLFCLLSEPFDKGPFGVSYENPKLEAAFMAVGFDIEGGLNDFVEIEPFHFSRAEL